MVKLAWTTERGGHGGLFRNGFGIVQTHDAACEGFGLGQRQPGPVPRIEIGDARAQQDGIQIQPIFIDQRPTP